MKAAMKPVMMVFTEEKKSRSARAPNVEKVVARQIEVVLTKFQPKTIIDMKNCLKEQENSYSIVLKNISELPVKVTLKKMPNGFSIKQMQQDGVVTTVEADSSKTVDLIWQPVDNQPVRASLVFSFMLEGKFRCNTELIVCGTVLPANNDNKNNNNMKVSSNNVLREINSNSSATGNKNNTSRFTAFKKKKVVKANQISKNNKILYDEKWAEKQTDGFTNWLNFIFNPNITAPVIGEDAGEQQKVAHKAHALLAQKQYEAKSRLYAYNLFYSKEMSQIIYNLDQEIKLNKLVVRKDKELYKNLGLRNDILDLLSSYDPIWLKLGLETIFGEEIELSSKQLEANFGKKELRRYMLQNILTSEEITDRYAETRQGIFHNKEYTYELQKHTLKYYLTLVLFLDHAKTSNQFTNYPNCLFDLVENKFRITASSQLVMVFSRDFLSGEGSILKHLSISCGYNLHHIQQTLDEYKFHVTNLAVDLRDGIKLVRAVELLTNNAEKTLSSKLRIPAVSRLQKFHNVELALKEMQLNHQISMDAGRRGIISKADIVDGNRHKTLALLWKMLVKWKLTGNSALVSEATLINEINRIENYLSESSRSIYHQSIRNSSTVVVDSEESKEESALTFERLLLKWCQVVCSIYKLEVVNFTTSFASGYALCMLVHHYHCELVNLKSLSITTDDLKTHYQQLKKPLPRDQYKKALVNEANNFKLINQCAEALGCVPILLPNFNSENVPEKKLMLVFITYLCSRLFASSNEIRAARNIQYYWFNFIKSKKYHSAITIQQFVRKYLRIKSKTRDDEVKQNEAEKSLIQSILTHGGIAYNNRRVRLQVKRISDAKSATAIQRVFRAFKARENYQNLVCSLMVLQANFRRRVQQQLYQQLQIQSVSAIKIQSMYRCYTQRLDYQLMIQASFMIQRSFKVFQARQHEMLVNSKAIMIQSLFRKHLAVEKLYALQHERMVLDCKATVIQTVFRMHIAREQLQSLQQHQLKVMNCKATVIQSAFRMHVAREELYSLQHDQLMMMNDMATVIQSAFRMHAARVELYSLKHDQLMMMSSMATVIQSVFRMHVAREKLYSLQHDQQMMMNNKATMIQTAFRMHVAREQLHSLQRDQLMMMNDMATVIQSAFRMHVAREKLYSLQHDQLMMMNDMATVIQSVFRMHVARGELYALQHDQFMMMNEMATVIQSAFRMHTAREELYSLKHDQLMMMNSMATVIQSVFRMHVAREKLYSLQHDQQMMMNNKATMIQTAFRMHVAREQLHSLQRDQLMMMNDMATVIQSAFRMYVAREKLYSLQHDQLMMMNNKASMIQTAFRMHVAREQLHSLQRDQLMMMNDMATLIQSAFRMHVAREKLYTLQYAQLMEMNDKATMIQSAFRMHVAREELYSLQHDQLMMMNANATMIQSAFRMHTAREKLYALQYAQLMVMNNKATMIQSVFRMHVAKEQLYSLQQDQLMMMNTNATMIQSAFRMHQAVQRVELIREETTVISEDSVATKIQSLFRGHQVRKRNNSKVNNMKDRIIAVSQQEVSEEKKLGSRTNKALHWLLNQSSLAVVLSSCEELEIATRYSEECCIEFIKTDAVTVLFRLINSLNRSQPHIKILNIILKIILNLAKCKKSIDHVFNEWNTALLVDLLQVYRDKTEISFKVIQLFQYLTNSSTRTQNYLKVNPDNVKRLIQINGIFKRKQEMDSKISSFKTSPKLLSSIKSTQRSYELLNGILSKLR